jgi:Rab proteins geranylgeranyltransferase component A
VLACSKPEVLWTMTYRSKGRSIDSQAGPIQSLMSGRVMIFPPPSIDLAFDDSILESVREMWKQIMGDEIEHAEFLRFEERRAGDDDA